MKRIAVATLAAVIALALVSWPATGASPVSTAKRALKLAKQAKRQASEADSRADRANDRVGGFENRLGAAEQNAAAARAATLRLNVGDWPNGQLVTVTQEISLPAGASDWTHADCGDGSAVASGGAAVIGPGKLVFSLREGNSWTAAVTNRNAAPTRLIVDAYCARGLTAIEPTTFPRAQALLQAALSG